MPLFYIPEGKSPYYILRTQCPEFRLSRFLRLNQVLVLKEGQLLAICGRNIPANGQPKNTILVFNTAREVIYTFSIDERYCSLEDMFSTYLLTLDFPPQVIEPSKSFMSTFFNLLSWRM